MVLMQMAVTTGVTFCGALLVDRLFLRRDAGHKRWPARLAMSVVSAVAALVGLLAAK